VLGWEPKIDLRAGLQMSLEYFRAAVRETGISSQRGTVARDEIA